MDLTKVPLNEYGHVQTRDGRPAKLLCIDRAGCTYPVLCLYKAADGSEVLTSCSVDGFAPTLCLTIIPVPAKVRVKGWLNVYRDGRAGSAYQTRDDATSGSGPDRIACIEIDREVTEGEGLA